MPDRRFKRIIKSYDALSAQAFDGFIKRLVNEARVLELTLSEMNLLWELGLREKMLVGEVARLNHLSKAAASQLVERLVKQGLLIREEDASNRRQKWIMLTKQGAKLSATMISSGNDALEDVLAQIPEDLVNRFETLLLDIAQELKTKGVGV